MACSDYMINILELIRLTREKNVRGGLHAGISSRNGRYNIAVSEMDVIEV